MARDRFSATDVAWQNHAACLGSAFDFVPDHESSKGLASAQNLGCNACPVRTECLAYALVYRMSGYWGGTDTRSRRLMTYHRTRTKCLLCGSKALIETTDGYEICLHCGMSWACGSYPRMSKEAAG